MANPLDLTGRWDGTYRYSDMIGPETPFVAEFTENGARFSGQIIEPNEFRAEVATAIVDGVRSGHAVAFTKTYCDAGPAYETPVDYIGQLSGDGQSITGFWALIEFGGTFEMHREQAIDAPAQASTTEAVSVET